MAAKQDSKGKQGFAAMSEEDRKAVASKGGKTSHKGESDADTSKADASKASAASSADAEDQGEELDELLEAFEDGDLTAIDLDEATEMMETWQETLSKSKESGLKEVGNSLKQLKKSLSSGKASAEDLTKLFTQLGEQVDAYASDAERGYKTKMHDLGRAFKRVARSLSAEAE
jgi:hypothetical protein